GKVSKIDEKYNEAIRNWTVTVAQVSKSSINPSFQISFPMHPEPGSSCLYLDKSPYMGQNTLEQRV
ncbi:hypothetical protein BUI56_12315, partial [Lactococcus lactis subsp. lactis]